jgi:hypothetical protein
MARTGAELMCGFTRDVGWVESAAFETILLDALANGPRRDGAERRIGSAAWSAVAGYLGFRIVYANGREWPVQLTNFVDQWSGYSVLPW